MTLSQAGIAACANDDEIFKLISAELTARLGPCEGDDLDLFLSRAAPLPAGLRAMAMTYQLDVSLALDDLGWHFANWHHRGYCDATLWALGELEATDQQALFGQAYEVAQQHWDQIGALLDQSFEAFVAWYPDSDLHERTLPLSRRMWQLQETKTILGYWVPYARKWPERVVPAANANQRAPRRPWLRLIRGGTDGG